MNLENKGENKNKINYKNNALRMHQLEQKKKRIEKLREKNKEQKKKLSQIQNNDFTIYQKKQSLQI